MFDMTILLYNVKLYITLSNSRYQNKARKGILAARRGERNWRLKVLISSCCVLCLSDFCAIWTKEEIKVVQQTCSRNGTVQKRCCFPPRIWYTSQDACQLYRRWVQDHKECGESRRKEKGGKTVTNKQASAFSVQTSWNLRESKAQKICTEVNGFNSMIFSGARPVDKSWAFGPGYLS